MEKQYRVLSSSVFKQGTSNKNGKTYKWTIYKATLDSFDGEVSGFAKVEEGDMVTVEEKAWEKDGKSGFNYNYTPVDGSAEGVAKAENKPGAGSTDKRTLKLMVLVADAVYRMQKQMGIEDDELLTPEKVKEALQVN